MTKARRPGTVEAALWRCKEILGIEQLADICGKSESMITRYLDIDDGTRNLPAKYITAIDAACKAETGETPLTSHLNRKLERMESAIGCPKSAALGIATAAGAVAHLIDVATSPASPGGERLTHGEAKEILPALDQVDRATDRARSRVKRYLGERTRHAWGNGVATDRNRAEGWRLHSGNCARRVEAGNSVCARCCDVGDVPKIRQKMLDRYRFRIRRRR